MNIYAERFVKRIKHECVIRGNTKSLATFRYRAMYIWYRWLCRRTRNCAGIKGRFSDFSDKAAYLYKIEYPRILHSDV
jgi:hypothetical protein